MYCIALKTKSTNSKTDEALNHLMSNSIES